ncbi:MAG TPA: ABC transporter permease, partial [Armatimonadetes bacterium]|nr:ABC transporter permease [Armatimonadota bacterium]
MNLWESMRVALTGLAANKMRSALTMLGVIIGVAAVIAMMAIAQGARADTMKRIEAMGTNSLMVIPGQSRQGRVRGGFGSSQSLTVGDAEAIAKLGPPIVRVSPEVSRAEQVKYHNANTNVSIQGTGADYCEIRNFTVERGRFFSQSDVEAMRRVCVIGPDTATNLFGQQNPVGKRIRIAGNTFQVLGVMKAKGTQGWMNPDDQIFVPYTTAMRRLFGMEYLRMISVQVTEMRQSEEAIDMISRVLRRRHRIAAGGEDDFFVRSQAEMME